MAQDSSTNIIDSIIKATDKKIDKESARQLLIRENKEIYKEWYDYEIFNLSLPDNVLIITYDISSVLVEEDNKTNQRRNELRDFLIACGAQFITKSTYGLKTKMTASQYYRLLQNLTIPKYDIVWVLTLTNGSDGHDKTNSDTDTWLISNGLK